MLAQPNPGDSFPYVQAMWRYLRAIGFIAERRFDAARAEAAAIAEIGRATDFRAMTAGSVPAPDLLRLARHVIAGRLAQAERQLQVAAAEFELAIAIEDALPYMEPAYWYYPVRQSLGAVLLAAHLPAEAEAVFRDSLLRVPNNPWALYGLQQAYVALGNTSAAAEIALLLDAAWAGPDELLDLARL